MKILLFFLIILSLNLYASLPDGSLPGHAPGLEFTQAEKLCEAINKRLPTAREWAKYAQDHGAQGILEIDYIQNQLSGQVPGGYTLIETLNGPLSLRDDFYYSNQNFKEPRSFSGSYSYWSSSRSKKMGANYMIAFKGTDDMSAWFIPADFERGTWCIAR